MKNGNGAVTMDTASERSQAARIGLVLKGYRRATGIMQSGLAAEIGINQTVLSQIEQGHSGLHGDTLAKILTWMLKPEKATRWLA